MYLMLYVPCDNSTLRFKVVSSLNFACMFALDPDLAAVPLWPPESTLRGKVVWITGASSGIGEELAYQLASLGARLIISARRVGALQKVKNRCLGKPAVRRWTWTVTLSAVNFSGSS